VRAGPLSAELRGADLVNVRWGGLEVASAVQVTVRDANWGTMRSALVRVDVREGPDGFAADLEATHGDHDFTWRGTIRGSSEGSLDFSMEGVAERDLVYRRIGICVLQPWSAYVDARFTATGPSTQISGTFPHEIVPQALIDGDYQAMIPAFERLEVAFKGGTWASFAFEGEPDGWELEDQRNWTDASFKTYPTPLRLSRPRSLSRGDRLRQRMRWQITGPPPQGEEEEGPVLVRIAGAQERRMPALGVTAPPGTALDAVRPAALGAAHVRVVANVPGDLDDLHTSASFARDTGVPLEVSFLLDDGEDGSPLASAVRILEDVPLARILLLRRSGATTSGAFVTGIRPHLSRLRAAPIVGGTASHFSELNRDPPEPSTLDAVALAMSPQVHEMDEVSMMQTLPIQAQIATCVRGFAAGGDVVITPVTLAAHDPSTPDDAIDERVGSDFGAAWTVGSTCALASAGADAVTLHERADRTVLSSEALTRAFGLLSSRMGRALDHVRSSDPRRVRALAAAGFPVLIANITPEAVEVRIEGNSRGRELEPYEVAELEPSPR
jgi:D-apionolactonase